MGSWAQSYTSIESVEYDAENDRHLVSNNTSIIARASDGSLSYFGDARANYGMEIMDGVLFAVYNSQIRAYDLETADQLSSLTITGASFLNGMASDGAGRLWITDFGAGRIYEVNASDPSSMSFEQVASFSGSPNGIVFDAENNRCVFVMWGTNAAIREMSLEDYNVSTITNTSLGYLDGIDRDADGNYYVASWSPTRITRYTSDFSSSETVVSSGLDNPADICFAPGTGILAVPNSGDNTLLLVEFETTDIQESDVSFKMNVYPNPSISDINFEFYLAESQDVSLDIYDLSGKHVANLLNGRGKLGIQRVVILSGELAPGNYISLLRVGKDVYSARFTFQ